MGHPIFFVREYDNAKQAKAERNIVPLAAVIQVMLVFIFKKNSSVDNEKH